MADVRKTVEVAARNLRYAGLDAVREFVWRTVHSASSTTDADPVLDADWNVLVVLDACRGDLFASVVGNGDYDRIPVGETRTSPASSSEEWLTSVFGDAADADLANLAYVTGNPFSAVVLDETRFAALDDVWRDAWDDALGTIPPNPITDRAIDVWRNGEADRMVVHYMQPHFPSLADPAGDGVPLEAFGDRPMSVWEDLRFGRRDVDDVRARYRANLEVVLEEVESLLANLDADRVVVTADHGNAFGEKHIYGHPGGVDLPCLREVPWSVTNGTDTRSREPLTRRDDVQPDGLPVEDRLEKLGYRT